MRVSSPAADVARGSKGGREYKTINTRTAACVLTGVAPGPLASFPVFARREWPRSFGREIGGGKGGGKWRGGETWQRLFAFLTSSHTFFFFFPRMIENLPKVVPVKTRLRGKKKKSLKLRR